MMERLHRIVGLSVLCWFCSGRCPWTSGFLALGTTAYGAWYLYMLVKTLQAAVIAPTLWGVLSRFVVVRYLTREEFFRADSPPEEIAKKREEALDRLEKSWKEKWGSVAETQTYLKKHFSDLRFKASGFESMYPIFQEVINKALDPITLVEKTETCWITDTTGHKFLDASGAYGVNCFGYTKSKEFLAAGQKVADEVGPCLGPLHPCVRENIELLLKLYNKEEVSFHMSGTEAIMSAVYQARFHTQKNVVAVFQGTYHGWWDGVMQGAGNDRFVGDCLILKDQCDQSLEALKARSSDIAALLVNPISGFGWKNATTNKLDTPKVDAGVESIEKFKKWLLKVRQTCTEAGIPLIYDETWAFHLGIGGAQELYGIQPDLLVLGKSLGGGHSCGAVLGPTRLMERRDPDRPMRVNFVVGTFKGNPVAMGAMNAVLKYVSSPEGRKASDNFRDRVATWLKDCNKTLESKDLPIRVNAHRTTWCISYKQHSIFNFLLMYYLRDAGLIMAWVGTGKMIFNMEFSAEDFKSLTDIIVRAATSFKEDGWWFPDGKPVNKLPLVLGPTWAFFQRKAKETFASLSASLPPSAPPAAAAAAAAAKPTTNGK